MKLLDQKLSDVLGLSAYESRVFLALSNFDKANISEISKSAGIPRTAVYPSIKSLLRKGLIATVVAGKRKHYKALAPKQLEAMFEWKRRDLTYVIDELSKHSVMGDQTLEVRFYPGKTGLNTAAEVFLDESKGKLWRTFENATVNQPALEFYQLEDYIDRRVKKGIQGKVIMSMNMMYPFLKERLSKDKEELRETVLVAEKNFPFRAVLGVNEHSVLVLSGDDVVFGAVIKNPQLAETISTLHEMIWTRYKV